MDACPEAKEGLTSQHYPLPTVMCVIAFDRRMSTSLSTPPWIGRQHVDQYHLVNPDFLVTVTSIRHDNFRIPLYCTELAATSIICVEKISSTYLAPGSTGQFQPPEVSRCREACEGTGSCHSIEEQRAKGLSLGSFYPTFWKSLPGMFGHFHQGPNHELGHRLPTIHESKYQPILRNS